MSELETRIQKSFSTVFPDLQPEDLQSAVLDVTPEWDSIATVNLVIVLEEEFSIVIDPNDFERLTSYASVVEFLKTHESLVEVNS